MKLKQPYVIVPNFNMGDHLCRIFNLPHKQIISGKVLGTLPGYGPEAAFILYTEGWDNSADIYDRIVERLEVSRATVIFCPEIMPVHRDRP